MMLYSWVEMARALWAKPAEKLSESGVVVWGALSPWGALPLAPEAAAWFEFVAMNPSKHAKVYWEFYDEYNR